MFIIRPYTQNDWNDVCHVHDRSRSVELKEANTEHPFMPLNEDPESGMMEQCRLLVACEEDGEVVGFSGSREEYLGWLYVDPDHMGKGVARTLLKESLKYTGPKAWTVTLAENKRARDLYESEGFSSETTYDSDDDGYPCKVTKMVRF